MAAVLLRRLYTTDFDDYWPEIDVEMQNRIKQEMLMGVQREQEDGVRKKMCDAMAEFARNMLGKGFYDSRWFILAL